MPTVTVRDIDIYYETAGGGERLLYIGGSSGDLRQSPNIFDSSLAQSFALLSYDQRGQGRTSKPAVDYHMADYADDAIGLLDAVGWDRCLLMGTSFGGMVAQELAIRYPARFERIAMACTSSGGGGGASYPLHTFRDLELRESVRRTIQLADQRLSDDWVAAHTEEFEAQVDTLAANRSIGRDDPATAEGSRRLMLARAKHDTYDRLPRVTTPVFLCGGKYDGIAPPENLEAIARKIPNAQLEFFEGGHMFLAQDPTAFPRAAAFLRGEIGVSDAAG
jgi:3-oxoadipate enol-lactonase